MLHTGPAEVLRAGRSMRRGFLGPTRNHSEGFCLATENVKYGLFACRKHTERDLRFG